MTGAIATAPRAAAARTASSTLARVLPLVAGAVVFAVAAFVVDGQPVGALRDDAMYVMLAKSIATGHGYRWLNLPGTPAAIHFPPGYPVLLAILWWLAPSFPANIVLFKLANTVVAAVSAVLLARFVRSRFDLPEWSAQLFAVAAMVAMPMLSLATQVLSEPLFLLLLVLTLIRAERVVDEPRSHWRELLAVGVLAGATTLVRTSGLALVVGIGVALGLRRRVRDAATFLLAAAVVLLPWQLWVAAHANVLPGPMRGNYESYGALVTDAVRTRGIAFLGAIAIRTSHDLGVMLQYVVAPGMFAPIRLAALSAVIVLAALGARPLWRKAPATSAFLVAYAVIVLFWPFTPGRFVWCIWPLLLLLPVLGARVLVDWSPAVGWQRLTKVAGVVAAAALAFGYCSYNLSTYRSGAWSTGPYATRMRPLLVEVVSRTPRNAVLATEAEGLVYLYTGRTTVPIGSFFATDYLQPRTAHESASGIETVLDRYHPLAVVVTTGFLRAAVSELAVRRPPRLAVVDTFPGGGLVLVPTPR